MSKDLEQIRQLAIQRFLKGENPNAICASLGKPRFWLYKWVKRFDPDDATWWLDRSRAPRRRPLRTPMEIEEIVKMIRLSLCKDNLFCGAKPSAGRWKI